MWGESDPEIQRAPRHQCLAPALPANITPGLGMTFQLSYITPGLSVLVRRFIPAQETLRTAVPFLGQLHPLNRMKAKSSGQKTMPGSNQGFFHHPSTTNKSSVHELG